MKIPIFMLFQFIGVISAWASKALEDGKITAAEGLELVVALAGILGVQAEFNISEYLVPSEDIEAVEIEETPGYDRSEPSTVNRE